MRVNTVPGGADGPVTRVTNNKKVKNKTSFKLRRQRASRAGGKQKQVCCGGRMDNLLAGMEKIWGSFETKGGQVQLNMEKTGWLGNCGSNLDSIEEIEV